MQLVRQQLEEERDPEQRANPEKRLEDAREQLRQAEEAHRRQA